MRDSVTDIIIGIALVTVLIAAIWSGDTNGYTRAMQEALDDPRHFIKLALRHFPEKALELEHDRSPSVEVQ